MFNKSLESSVLPDCWKEAPVTPVFKKGDHTLANNYSYRPISLTSPICKIMESIINDNIQEHLEANNVIPPQQHHGFTAKDLVQLSYEWLDKCTRDAGHSVDILYFDFAKWYAINC